MTAPNPRTVAVAGATGAAGRAAARALVDPDLWATGDAPAVLRLGGRRPDALAALAADLPTGPGTPRVETVALDVTDDDALARFCAGTTTVLNCAGPSYAFGDRVPRAAVEAGADVADVSGYDPVRESLTAADIGARGRAAVLAAGIYPGLSVLVPRWLAARSPGTPRRLRAYLRGLEEATAGSAADLVLSVGDGAVWGAADAALAAWRGGRRRDHALRVVDDVELPFFPDRLTVQPFLPSEAEWLAEHLGLEDLDWHNVFIGGHMRGVLNRLRGDAIGADPAPEEVARRSAELLRACALDVGGRDPYYVMAYWLDVEDGHSRCSAVLRTRDTFAVTGAVGAMAVAALSSGDVAPGVHLAGSVLDPEASRDRGRAQPPVLALDAFTTDDAGTEPDDVEVGAL